MTSTITIDKGVPIPPKRPATETIFPFADMQPGDSFARQLKEGQDLIKLRARLVGAAHSWAKRHAPGAKFTTRVEPDGKGMRIWPLTKPVPLAPISVAELPVAKMHKLANKEDERFDAGGRASPKRRGPARKPPVAFDIPSFAAGGKTAPVKGSRKIEPEVMVKRVLDAAENSGKRVVKGSRY